MNTHTLLSYVAALLFSKKSDFTYLTLGLWSIKKTLVNCTCIKNYTLLKVLHQYKQRKHKYCSYWSHCAASLTVFPLLFQITPWAHQTVSISFLFWVRPFEQMCRTHAHALENVFWAADSSDECCWAEPLTTWAGVPGALCFQANLTFEWSSAFF